LLLRADELFVVNGLTPKWSWDLIKAILLSTAVYFWHSLPPDTLPFLLLHDLWVREAPDKWYDHPG